MGLFDRINEGLARSRDRFRESMNVLLDRGPRLDDEFWDGLEETLILSDIGGAAASDIVENLRDQATRQALPDAYAVLDMLKDQIADTFTTGGDEILGGDPSLVLFVGINGTGKTTTVGKLAKEATDSGRKVILGSADTFRAAAIEQLEVWAKRAQVEMVTRERGADPASVCYDTIERAEACGADLVLIDTAGRLHTSNDLMRELSKVVNVVRKRSKLPVYTVLVIDATTGQNGMQQAREFNRALDLDALIVTKLDGTAKGGIALAVSHELGLPIIKIGVGEAIEDLREFNANDFASALIGTFDERFDEDEDSLKAKQDEPADDVELDAEPRLDVEELDADESLEDRQDDAVVETADAFEEESDVEGVQAVVADGKAAADEAVDGEQSVEGEGQLQDAEDDLEGEEPEGDCETEGELGEFSDEELAELALAASDEEEQQEQDSASEPEKKPFWKFW